MRRMDGGGDCYCCVQRKHLLAVVRLALCAVFEEIVLHRYAPARVLSGISSERSQVVLVCAVPEAWGR